FFSSRRRHTRFSRDWSSDVCSSDLGGVPGVAAQDNLLLIGGGVNGGMSRVTEKKRGLSAPQELSGDQSISESGALLASGDQFVEELLAFLAGADQGAKAGQYQLRGALGFLAALFATGGDELLDQLLTLLRCVFQQALGRFQGAAAGQQSLRLAFGLFAQQLAAGGGVLVQQAAGAALRLGHCATAGQIQFVAQFLGAGQQLLLLSAQIFQFAHGDILNKLQKRNQRGKGPTRTGSIMLASGL